MNGLQRSLIRIVVLCLWGILLCTCSCADELTYYVYPSPVGIDWETPNSLAWSVLFNQIFQDRRYRDTHSIGHVNFHLKCEPSNELPEGSDIEIGQTSSNDDELLSSLLDKGYGLGEFLSDYSGRWESKKEIEQDLPLRFSTGRIAYLHFRISPKTCARVTQYLREYAERGYDRIYGGLQMRPRYGEGGGCIAFGESVLDVAGLFTPEWQRDWRRFVRVPYALIGGPMTGRHVSVLHLLFGFNTHEWAEDPSHSFPLTFSDPDRVFDWIHTAWKKAIPLTGLTYRPVQTGRARGLDIDARAVPTPQDGFWLTPAS